MAKRNLQALALLCIIALALIGCGPRRSTEVDPLPDPLFREVPGTLDYQPHRPSHGTSTPTPTTGQSNPRTTAGPWTVSNLSKRWNYIIIHHSAGQTGGAQSIGKYHSKSVSQGGRGYDELGYHFVIGNGTDTADGKIEVGPRWYKQKHGAHTRVPGDSSNRYNEHGIGICLVGDFQQSRPSRKQIQALIYLTRGLMAYTGLPASAVRYHQDFKSTNCPGRYFPYRQFKQALRR